MGLASTGRREPLDSDEAWPVSLEREILFWTLRRRLWASCSICWAPRLPHSRPASRSATCSTRSSQASRGRDQPARRIASHPGRVPRWRSRLFHLVAPILGNQLVASLNAAGLRETSAGARGGGGRRAHREIRRPVGARPWSDGTDFEQQIQKSIGDFVGKARNGWSTGSSRWSRRRRGVQFPVAAHHHAGRRLLILVDWDRMIAEIDSWLPLDHRDRLRKIAREINHALAGFIRGQSLVCLFLGLWYASG